MASNDRRPRSGDAASQVRRAAEAQRRHAAKLEREQKTRDRVQKLQADDALASGAARQTQMVTERVEALRTILRSGLRHQPPGAPVLVRREFDPGALAHPEPPAPPLETFMPSPLSGLQRMLPGGPEKHRRLVAQAEESHRLAVQARESREQARVARLEAARAAHQKAADDAERRHAQQLKAEADLAAQASEGDEEAVRRLVSRAITRTPVPQGITLAHRMEWWPDSRQMVVALELPAFDIAPAEKAFRYVKTRQVTEATARSLKERREIYAEVLQQLTLLVLRRIFDATPAIELVTLNGMVSGIDPAIGRTARPCVITVRTNREDFDHRDLEHVDPTACLKSLHASVSKAPDELAPVRPVVEFTMVDERFVEASDVLSGLGPRTNLMEISPVEFESLVANLFTAMGFDTRPTQRSGDGGVDCVAYNHDPVLGGKVIIQAKRYRKTVGVAAVRELWGTVQHEGASKGILVTTADFGPGAYKFVEDKPIELLAGNRLLWLLEEHAGIKARIQRDPVEEIEDPSIFDGSSPTAKAMRREIEERPADASPPSTL